MLTAAIIGTGGMGGVHSKCYKTMQENGQALAVIAAADIIPEKTTSVTEVHPEARSYASLDELEGSPLPPLFRRPRVIVYTFILLFAFSSICSWMSATIRCP